MDLGNSTYKTRMRFFVDDAALWLPVRWYYVPWDRPVIPGLSPFRRRVWEWPDFQEDLGEDLQLQTPSNGKPPAAFVGNHFCGTLAQWENGCLTTDPVSPIDPLTGQATCCGAIRVEQGGSRIGGTSTDVFTPSQFITVPWSTCPIPRHIKMYFSAFPLGGTIPADLPLLFDFWYNPALGYWQCTTPWLGAGGLNALSWVAGVHNFNYPDINIQQPATDLFDVPCLPNDLFFVDMHSYPVWGGFIRGMQVVFLPPNNWRVRDQGGAKLGGTSVDSYFAAGHDAATGGAELGGTSVDSYHAGQTDAATGGAELGGTSVDNFAHLYFDSATGGAELGGTSVDSQP